MFHFSEKESLEYRTIHGHINYGIYGFESNLIDINNGKINYERTTQDSEEIPLYFQFWIPDNQKIGYAIFQSFQGRSCNTLVLNEVRRHFKDLFKETFLRIEKLMPEQLMELDGDKAFVKELRLIKRKPPQDVVERLISPAITNEVREIELAIKAKRNKVIGSYSKLKEIFTSKSENGVLTHDGIEFDRINAEVDINGRRRIVGMLTPSKNTGVIDITDEVKIEKNGHPKFDSIANIASQLISDFHTMTN